ncbi:c-type cytochrome domain-containing protein [Ideonella sp. A 288]|uniref:c-type cytochrome domain-containing protein n=1 Tax=Ideonella sp. A 288 TaxID=1962181 RepID=UPI001F33AA3F|nr:c-type cytochrome domain-containing protein [Ideonella sp. A 288]
MLTGAVALCVALLLPMVPPVARAQAVGYDEIAPLLAARCVMCHTGTAAPLGLKLDTIDGLLAGSQRGLVVKAGDPAGSELIRRLKGSSQPRMPMTGPPWLSDAEVALFERWVATGLGRGKAGAVPAAQAPAPARPGPGEPVTYAHVAPIFATRCAKCHAPNGLMGAAPEGLVLNAYEATLDSRDRARVVPGQPAASELVRRIRGQARPRMPFDGPPWLSDDETALVTEWVRQGARNAEGRPAPVPVGAEVRLHGTLQGPWQLDELALVPAPSRRDRSPGVGGYAEVRGRVQADGGIVPQRVRGR